MKEDVARAVVLVRAIETEDKAFAVLSAEDRLYASRSAKELARWQAADAKTDATFAQFLQQRAEQILKRLAERIPSFGELSRATVPLGVLSVVLPVLALLVGFGVDRITDPHRVDLLSAPLLLIIGWNLAVYAAIPLLHLWAARKKPKPQPALLERLLSVRRFRIPRKWPQSLVAATTTYLADWAVLSRPLVQARITRAWHLAAAAFALGALASLYLRGVLSQYLAGWESTFLDAAQVHAVLGWLFAPAMAVFPLQGFSMAEIEALHFGTGAGTPLATGGARWVHLYAATLLLLVVLPRGLLALWSHAKAQRLSHKFALDLNTAYFRKLEGVAGGNTGNLRVLPYSVAVNEARDRGLATIATMLLGDQARVVLRPPIAYGEDMDEALRGVAVDAPQVAITAVLFNLAATPETENHGALLDHLHRVFRSGFMVLVDESGYLERQGIEAGAAARMAQRVALWESFCRFHHSTATIVNLMNPIARPIDAYATTGATGQRAHA